MGRLRRAVQILHEDGAVELASAVRAFAATRALDWSGRFAQEIGITRHMSGDRFDDVRRHVPTESPVVVDGGANVGQSIDAILAAYEDPTIHAFEPIPELANRLAATYSDANVIVHQKALGAEPGAVSFNVTARPGQSSILSPAEAVDTHAWRRDIEREVEVEQIRLDTVLDHVDVLKLDLQGYELEALRGAVGLFDELGAILSEVEFVRLYEGAPLFHELTAYLAEHDFRLYNLYGLTTDDNSQLMYADALYVPGDYGEEPPL